MVIVAQLVRAPDCGSGGRRFEPGLSPKTATQRFFFVHFHLCSKNTQMLSYEFIALPLNDKVQLLYREGSFVVSIRYYSYKINLYLLNNYYVEVFYNHKLDKIEKIELLNSSHSRMKFDTDQISLPKNLLE